MKAIHAGLECGIIGEKFPGMDMVSIGPWIEHPHSPDERVNMPSVEKFWKLLKAVLAELATKQARLAVRADSRARRGDKERGRVPASPAASFASPRAASRGLIPPT